MCSGTFCCKGCYRRWVSHRLILTDREGISGIQRQCFNCKVQVSAQDVEVLNRICLGDESCITDPPTKSCGFIDNQETATVTNNSGTCFESGQHAHLVRQCPNQSRLNRRACYGCGQLGHLVQDCQSRHTKFSEKWKRLDDDKKSWVWPARGI